MFETKLRINFFDTDAAGILFFGNLFRLAHHAYELFLEKISPRRNFFDDQVLLPIVHSEADYKAPLKAGDVTNVKLFVSKLGESSFELTYQFFCEGILKAQARTVHVSVDKEKFKKISLPSDLKNSLMKYFNK